jgi:hypothetical protein
VFRDLFAVVARLANSGLMDGLTPESRAPLPDDALLAQLQDVTSRANAIDALVSDATQSRAETRVQDQSINLDADELSDSSGTHAKPLDGPVQGQNPEEVRPRLQQSSESTEGAAVSSLLAEVRAAGGSKPRRQKAAFTIKEGGSIIPPERRTRPMSISDTSTCIG